MKWFVLGWLIGMFLGAGLAKNLDDDTLSVIDKEKWRVFLHYFLIFSIFTSGLFIYFQYREHFAWNENVHNLDSLIQAMLSNPIFQQMLYLCMFLVLLLFLLLLIKSPFINWEHIKLLGFEAKTAIKEKAEKQAKEELDYMFLIENVRLDTLELISSNPTLEIIHRYIDAEQRQFDGKHALEEILDSLSILYRESYLNCTIRYGVITIYHGQVSVSDYDEYMKLPQYLREDIDYVLKTNTTETWNHNDIFTFVTPLAFLYDKEVYYIVFLSSYEMEFNHLTEKQFIIIKNLIENYLRLSNQ